MEKLVSAEKMLADGSVVDAENLLSTHHTSLYKQILFKTYDGTFICIDDKGRITVTNPHSLRSADVSKSIDAKRSRGETWTVGQPLVLNETLYGKIKQAHTAINPRYFTPSKSHLFGPN